MIFFCEQMWKEWIVFFFFQCFSEEINPKIMSPWCLFVRWNPNRKRKSIWRTDLHLQRKKMMGGSGICVNTAKAFDGMKNYILVFALPQRCFVICADTHVRSANTAIQGFEASHTNTHMHSCKQTHLNAHTHTQIIWQEKPWHVMYAGMALKCMSLSIYLCQSLCPSCSHASLLPGNHQAKLWAQQRLLWACWQTTPACPRYVALTIICTLYG